MFHMLSELLHFKSDLSHRYLEVSKLGLRESSANIIKNLTRECWTIYFIWGEITRERNNGQNIWISPRRLWLSLHISDNLSFVWWKHVLSIEAHVSFFNREHANGVQLSQSQEIDINVDFFTWNKVWKTKLIVRRFKSKIGINYCKCTEHLSYLGCFFIFFYLAVHHTQVVVSIIIIRFLVCYFQEYF